MYTDTHQLYSAYVNVPLNSLEFIEEEIPQYHPLSQSYIEYWREQKKRCIEGHWNAGVWMPGKLYFYVNFGTIRRNKKGSKVKYYLRPLLRDLEWMFFYNWEEARGFSGFSEDPLFSCHRALLIEDITDIELVNIYCSDEGQINDKKYNNLFTSDGKRKKYIPAREYLRTTHATNLGKPYYFNESQNLMMLGARGYGKSFSVGVGIVLHEWLFDGLTEYIAPSDQEEQSSAEIIVGAGDAKYTADLLDKTKVALEHLPGKFESSSKIFPSPFSKQYRGSWGTAKQVVAEYKKKVGGNWDWVGSKSTIKNRTFKDNAFAAQGSRAGVMVFEEVGMFENLIDSYNASVECMRDGARKFGTAVFIGTGGDFEGGGTRDAYDMFYHPEKYEMVVFEDIWEHKGSIGYFVPAYLGLNQYKDNLGRTDVDSATKELIKFRENLKKQRGSVSALNNELQYRPLKPSEVFLSKSGNIFPVAEIKDRLTLIENDPYFSLLEKKVTLSFNAKERYGVSYKIDTKNDLHPINEFPWKESSREGCIVIYEFPLSDDKGNIPEGLYIIGHDPYASDDPNGGSLAATYVLKTKKYWDTYGHDEIVAVYVARPYDGRHVVNENLMKLSMLYGNAKIYYENVVGNVKEYFEKMKRLDLLAKSPQTVFNKKASFSSGPSHSYGYPMSSRSIKMDGIQYIRDWLLEPRGKEGSDSLIRNLDRIWDKALLQEMIAFDLDDGNFDRVMGFMGCIIGLNETYNQYEKALKEEGLYKDYGLDLSLLVENKSLFRQELRDLDIDWKNI